MPVVEQIGRVVRLQVQRASLKVGPREARAYDPAPLLAVPTLRLGPDGVVGLPDAGQPIVDVHNRQHPTSKHNAVNGVSVGFTTHYLAMRERFGPHLADGIAGENVVVETERDFRSDDLRGTLVIGQARLSAIVAAEPCEPFSRFALAGQADGPADPRIADALRFLRHGTRGYYATVAAEAVVRLGDPVYLA
jgi:MOSC domain-containing protein YiiM